MLGKHLFSAMFFVALALPASALTSPEAATSAPKPSNQQTIDDLVRQCVNLTCRTTARHFSLQTVDGKTVEGDTLPFPYVNDKGTVFVYPDETVSVALVRQGDKLAPPIFVTATDPRGTVASKQPNTAPANFSFQLRQLDKEHGMILVMTNRLDANVKLDLVMYVPVAGGMRGIHNSSCPMLAPQLLQQSFGGVEQWPHPVMMMAISNIHILPPGAPRVCE